MCILIYFIFDYIQCMYNDMKATHVYYIMFYILSQSDLQFTKVS